MIENIILQHKEEKESLLVEEYIPREKLQLAEKFLGQNLIKVISGPRRSGKSVFSILLLKDKNFAYVNFDDDNLLKIKNSDEIIKGISQIYPKSDFILFDEIQNLENWELFVNKLQRRGRNIIITGSNARLLSRDLATVLTGRYIPVEILPFSFREFLRAKDFGVGKEDVKLPQTQGEILAYLDQYLISGGFPEIIVKGMDSKLYLQMLFDAILFKDVVKRYNIRFSQKLYELSLYLISNFCCEYSFSKIKNILGFRSPNTVLNYLKYLEESYLFFTLTRFSFKLKEQLKAPKKIYVVDNGLISAKSFQSSQNRGRSMENLVFIELLRKGYKINQDLFYYRTRNGREIDFLLKKGTKVSKLIQVCFDIEDPKVEKRELKGLIEGSEELRCADLSVITWDCDKEERIKDNTIKFVPLWNWLLSS